MIRIAATAALCSAIIIPAAQAAPTAIGRYDNWTVFTEDVGGENCATPQRKPPTRHPSPPIMAMYGSLYQTGHQARHALSRASKLATIFALIFLRAPVSVGPAGHYMASAAKPSLRTAMIHRLWTPFAAAASCTSRRFPRATRRSPTTSPFRAQQPLSTRHRPSADSSLKPDQAGAVSRCTSRPAISPVWRQSFRIEKYSMEPPP